MPKALTFPRDITEKTVELGGPNPGTTITAAAGGAPVSREQAAKTAAAKAWRDNVTGAVYTDPAQCVNGCTQLVGEAAEKGIRTGKADAPALGYPPSADEQTDRELERLRTADAERTKSEREAAAQTKDSSGAVIDKEGEAEVKQAKATENKARKTRPTTKAKK